MSSADDRDTEAPASAPGQDSGSDLDHSHVDVHATTDGPAPVSLNLGEEWIGSVVAERYLVQKLLGKGGMGAVFQAEHVHMKKLVALKLLHTSMHENPEVVARFEREAVAAGRLQHPGVVGATDFGSLADGTFYLALELVDGMSLADALEGSGAIAPERALGIAFQINSALVAAHAEGIVHRDLKPDNIMLVETGDAEDFVKVLDFGIAKIRLDGDHQEGLTRAGLVFGTPEYMSPEQAMGHEADARSDLYTLGVMLFEMCVGNSPFHHEDLTAMLTAQITEPAPELPENVPRPLAKLIHRLMEKQPDARPQSAAELSEELADIAEKLVWQLPSPRTSAGTRLDLTRRSSVDKREIEIREAPNSRGALQSVRALSMAPISIGSKKVPAWIPFGAMLVGGVFGAFAMLSNEEVAPSPAQVEAQEKFDAEAQLLTDARSGDRDAIAELRKLVVLKEKELKTKGILPLQKSEGSELPVADDPGKEVAKPSVPPSAAKPSEELDAKEAKLVKPESPPTGADGDEISAQANRYMALGRGYSEIKHSTAATEMYQQAVQLDPHLAEDPDLLIDVRVALGARDAVEAGLDFALESLGAHGADLIYDVYLDHLGEAGMTPVVARAMRLVEGKELAAQATEDLRVALELRSAKYCADYRSILPRAALHADDRSVQKLRALKSRRGCGTFGNKDCFVCLRKDENLLDQAVLRAETHPSPVFLTPAEAQAER